MTGGEVFVHNVHIGSYTSRGTPITRRCGRENCSCIATRSASSSEDHRTGHDAGAGPGCTSRTAASKIAISLAKGKQAHDKRETIRRREIDRESRAAIKSHGRRPARPRVPGCASGNGEFGLRS